MRKIVEGSLDDRFLRAIFDPKKTPAAVSAAAEQVAIASAAQHGSHWPPYDNCNAALALRVQLEPHQVTGRLRQAGSGRNFGDCDRVTVAWLSEDGEAVLDSALWGNVTCPGLEAVIATAEAVKAEAAEAVKAEADARQWFRERFENAAALLEEEGFLSREERMVLRTQHAAADAALRHMAPAMSFDYDACVAAECALADLVADWVNGDLQAAKPVLS